MDSHRFDDLARSFAKHQSRRSVLRGLAGGVAAALAMLGHEATADHRQGHAQPGGGGGGAKGPDPCAVFCADQPGARGAQCRQACRACGSDPAGLYYDAATGSFACNGCRSASDCGDSQYCQVETCGGIGTCQPVPLADPGCPICPQFFDPVCGCDNVTYPNACFAGCAGQSFVTGECPA